MGSRVLVVEDNPMNFRLVRHVLEARGHIVECAVSVPEARDRLDEALDIVLLDIQIPGGGGLALLDEIRRNPAIAKIPVVAVTALAMEGDRESLITAGFDEYIAKPINTRTFGPIVEMLIAVGRRAR